MDISRFKAAIDKYKPVVAGGKSKGEEAAPSKKNPYISTPNQLRALQLARKFGDEGHKILYFNLCKNVHPAIIDQAESFVSDAPANNKGALFMWRVKQVKQEWQSKSKDWRNPAKPAKNTSKRRRRKTTAPSLFDEL